MRRGLSVLVLTTAACTKGAATAPAATTHDASATPLAPAASAPRAGATSAAASGAGPCEGPRLSLTGAIADARCRISETEADTLRAVLEDPARAPLAVEASVLADGRVSIRVTNTGGAPQTLPLLVHSNLDSFAVRERGVELARAEVDWPAGFHFDAGRMLAKITLPPGGTAEATLRIVPSIVRHEQPDCPPNAKCAPVETSLGPLPPGKHRLQIRTPLYSIRDDLAATVAWAR